MPNLPRRVFFRKNGLSAGAFRVYLVLYGGVPTAFPAMLRAREGPAIRVSRRKTLAGPYVCATESYRCFSKSCFFQISENGRFGRVIGILWAVWSGYGPCEVGNTRAYAWLVRNDTKIGPTYPGAVAVAPFLQLRRRNPRLRRKDKLIASGPLAGLPYSFAFGIPSNRSRRLSLKLAHNDPVASGIPGFIPDIEVGRFAYSGIAGEPRDFWGCIFASTGSASGSCPETYRPAPWIVPRIYIRKKRLYHNREWNAQ